MNRKDLFNRFIEADGEHLEQHEVSAKHKKTAWSKLGALTICLCLFLSTVGCHQSEKAPDELHYDLPPSLSVNGVTYVDSPHFSVTNVLPDGFLYAGETSIGGVDGFSYYTNVNVPERVYVYQEVTSDGTLDESGSLNRTEPYGAFVRYVDARLRGKDLVCYNGAYYISMWSADYYSSTPDVTEEYYNEIRNKYDICIKGDAPEGFVSIGITEFFGHDTIPSGTLSSNEGEYEVYANPDEPNVIFVETQWHTAPIGKDGETSHNGFHVYIRYDCPVA